MEQQEIEEFAGTTSSSSSSPAEIELSLREVEAPGPSSLAPSETETLENKEGEIGRAQSDTSQVLSSSPPSRQSQEVDHGDEQNVAPTAECLLLTIIGGLMIGYALSFTGGLPKMDAFLRQFSSRIFTAKKKAVETDYCIYTNTWLLLFLALIPLSALPGIWLGLFLACGWGRKPILVLGSGFCIVGACASTWFPSTGLAATSMICLGLGVGVMLQVIPMVYLEIAPPVSKGWIDLLFQYMMSLGSVLAWLVNYTASYFPDWGWRLSYGMLIPLAFALLLVSCYTKETPKWLFQHGSWMRATRELSRLRRSDNAVKIELAIMAKDGHQDTEQLRDVTHHRSRPVLVIRSVAQLLQQLVGMSSLIFFGSMLLESLGYTSHQVFLGPLCASIFIILAFGASTYFLNRVGRRIPLILSCIMISTTQFCIWLVFYLDGNINYHLSKPDSILFLLMVAVSVLSYGIISAPHGWIDDDYHGEGKALGKACESSVYVATVVVMSQITLRLFCGLAIWVFIFMSIIALSKGVIIFYFVPETTGIPVDEIADRIWSQHWFWRRFFL